MKQGLEYYLYLLLLINLIGSISLIFSLPSDMMIIAEVIFVVLSLMVSAYLVYAYERKGETPHDYSMMFFAAAAINSAIIYFLTSKIDAAFLGFLNVLGIYVTPMIARVKVPKDLARPKNTGKSEDFRKGITPLKTVAPLQTPPSEESKKPAYLLEELERELERAEKKYSKESVAKKSYDASIEKDILDDPDVVDESEIIVEEIKPTKEPDLHPAKRAKKHIPSKSTVKAIENLMREIEKKDEADYDREDPFNENEEVIEELKPIKAVKLPKLKKVKRSSKPRKSVKKKRK